MARIELDDGSYLELHEGWIDEASARSLFHALERELPFAARTLREPRIDLTSRRVIAEP